MNGLSFLFSVLCLVSFDTIVAIILFTLYKYLDMKYFSSLEIEQLKVENSYLKEENKKIKGTSTNFWSEE